jgi:uncharacterized protein (DUF1778 family)
MKSINKVSRPHTIALRVSDEERQDIESAAKAARVGVSGFLRNLFYSTVATKRGGQGPSLIGATKG